MVFDFEKEFFQALEEINDIQSYQAETYLDGELFHVDSVQCLGENPISLVSEYLFPMARRVLEPVKKSMAECAVTILTIQFGQKLLRVLTSQR